MPEFIFTMRNLTKVHPPDKEVLKDVTLAFYPGAKIGVLGANGAGKSSLLRIMAGVDTEVRGEADLAEVPAWACWSRSRSWTSQRTCAATWRTACGR